MKFHIEHQEQYSRGELLLRTFFGFIYILIPHLFVLAFIAIGAMVVNFLSFWIILFTGNFPRSLWDFILKFMIWGSRVNARLNNLVDGYPAFGLNAVDPQVIIEMEYPENQSRGLVLLRTFFGWLYVLIPHMICLLFLSIGAAFVRFIAFWVVLFTGKYPKGMHDFMVGVLRWGFRVNAYLYNLTDTYPPFTLEEVN